MVEFNRNAATILVTDADRGSSISIIRSLGRKGYRVIAADSDPASMGFRSRYAKERVLYPPPESSSSEFIDSLYKTVIDWDVDLVIPVTDAAILPLSKARDLFKGHCQLAIPEVDDLEVVINKLKTLELANRLGVPIPRSYLVESTEEALQKGQELGWPLVLKPQVSRLYKDNSTIEAFSVCYAENLEHLTKQMAGFEDRCPVLLQEYYPGTGYGVELLLDNSKPIAVFQHKRLREIPINGGASSFRMSVPVDMEMYNYSLHMLQVLNWTGLAMVEFKVGKQGPKLMEINGRVWGSLPLAVRSGVDFPARLAELYLSSGKKEIANSFNDYKVGVRVRNLQLDILWIITVLIGKRRYPFLPMPARNKALLAVLEMFHPAAKFDILTLEDPLPGLIEVLKILPKLWRKRKSVI